MQRMQRKVAMLHKGEPEIPFDLHGVLYAKFNENVLEASEWIRRRLEGVDLINAPQTPPFMRSAF